MKQVYTPLITFLLFLNILAGQAQVLVSSEFISNTPSALLSLVNNQFPIQYDVDFYKLVYNTVDTQGQPTLASGAIAVPSSTCETLPLLAYCHGTVLRKQDIPSAENGESLIGKLFAGGGYVSIMPDYIGLGESSGLHPYVHAESQATATLDMIRAAREFLSTELDINHNNQLFLTGYSQGGHAAMGTHKYIQDNSLYDEFNVVASAPCSGPYDLSGSQAPVLTSGQPYSNPGYVVYLIMGYQRAYGNLYNTLSDVLKSPYDVDMLTYFDGVQDQYDMGTVNNVLPNVLSDFMQDTTLSNFMSNPNHPLRVALEDNDNFDWTPERPVRMMYCTGDEQVDFSNSISADSAMNANGASDVDAIEVGGNSFNHGACVTPALTETFNFFEPKTTFCGFVQSTENASGGFEFSVYPNPTENNLSVAFPITEGTVDVLNLQGQVMQSQSVNTTVHEFELDQFSAGIYFVRWNHASGTNIQKIIKK